MVAVVAVAALPPILRPEAVPVKFVAVPELGVHKAPPFTTGEPAVPTLTARAVPTPVPSPVIPPTATADAVPALPVIEPVIAFVTSKSVNQPLVTRVAVAPIVVTKRLAHFLSVVPRSSVLSVSETSEVLIATLARFERAVLAHAAGISEVSARVPVVAGAVSTTPVPATALGCIVTSPEVFP